MFTGIVEEVGKVRQVVSGQTSGEIAITAHTVLENTKIGDSIAVNGVCLTVTSLQATGFTADVMPETLRRTNLGQLMTGDPVDLERAMAADGRFGGHIVSGHIDGVGQIVETRKEGNAVWVRIQAPAGIMALLVEKGSIAIDGISLTVAKVEQEHFEVSLIPHTGQQTILLGKKPGAQVNLENDILGKYVQRLLGLPGAGSAAAALGASGQSAAKPQSKITMEFLSQHGF